MRLREHAHPVLTDEGGAILDERSGRWTHLTPTAAAALLVLCASSTHEQAVGQYAARYPITPGQADTDITAVTIALAAAGLAGTGGPCASANRRTRRRWWR
ncbi:PqqD family peptide modification chaperone [Streptomyces sp. NPDC057638]|uniref:PqqD family peptide modification chaperone n=1 Tax=Streptomyces sp. NPDC057638 TaxID=3346190 RepID=UPI0036A4EAB8